jgi:predicted RNase H-related nuclease YkuK (DUF458 family)
MLDRRWKTLSGESVADVTQAVQELLASGDRVVHIGTDAQKIDQRIEFVTCIVLLEPGKGGRVFYTRVPRSLRDVRSLRQKLFTEAWMSVETAMQLNPHLPDELPIVVHLDVNPDQRWASSRHIHEVVGLVVGQGFEVLFKPEAWAASHAADHALKRRALMRD